jgi:cobalt-zinc-cadmium efflux system protein
MTEHSHADHEHHEDREDIRTQSKTQMTMVLIIICLYMVAEVVTALFTHSLALLADAGHLITDVGGITLGLIALWFAAKPATLEKTYGYYRSEILAGFLNALALAGISIFIVMEAYQRLKAPPEVASGPVFAIALLGIGVNFVALKLLGGHHSHSVNTRAAYLEILSDFVVSIGVMISSVIIYFTHWYAADPIVSALIAIFILPRTWLLLRECTNILMEGTPQHVDLASLSNAMLKVNGVVEVHDIHVWTITSGLDAMSGHVRIADNTSPDEVLEAVTKVCKDFKLKHTTIQVEQVTCANGTCAKPEKASI